MTYVMEPAMAAQRERHGIRAEPLLGASVTADRVVGRDALVAEIWEVLDTQSVLLTAERRIGKSAVLNKLAASPPPGWIVVKRAVESTSSPSQLIDDLRDDLAERLPDSVSTWRKLKALYQRLGVEGLRLGSFELPHVKESWKDALRDLLSDAGAVEGRRVLVVWDEFPNMIWAIAHHHGAGVAAELVDLLRNYRQENPDGVRFVVAGSIGFHLVLRRLAEARAHRGRPANDLRAIEVGAISPADAARLAKDELLHLRAGDRIAWEGDVDAIAAAVAAAADGLPFYVEHIIDKLRKLPPPFRVADVGKARDALLASDTGQGDLRNYRARIGLYYPEREKPSCLAILDLVSSSPGGLTVDHILSGLPADHRVTRSLIVDALALLLEDHYILAKDGGRGRSYAFKFPLVRDWWARSK